MAESSYIVCPDSKCRAVITEFAEFCPRCGTPLKDAQRAVDYAHAGPEGSAPRILEIDTGRSSRLWRLFSYIVLYIVVGALVVMVMTRFGVSVPLALALVLFMAVYMTLVGYRASKHLEERNKGTDF